ncbi:hypothetical protein V1507DRAFT_451123 [Lipomyces tetrasporus]
MRSGPLGARYLYIYHFATFNRLVLIWLLLARVSLNFACVLGEAVTCNPARRSQRTRSSAYALIDRSNTCQPHNRCVVFLDGNTLSILN